MTGDRAELALARLNDALIAYASERQEAANRPLPSKTTLDHIRAHIDHRLDALCDTSWINLRVAMDLRPTRDFLINSIGPLVAELAEVRSSAGWWYLVKRDVDGVAMRLRIATSEADRGATHRAIDAWLESQQLRATFPVYEPEYHIFGGPVGMHLAHQVFCADSAFVQAFVSAIGPATDRSLLPVGLSLIALVRLIRATGADDFELVDIFERVKRMRPLAAESAEKLPQVTRWVTVLLEDDTALFPSIGAPVEHAFHEYLKKMLACGEQFSTANVRGQLQGGIRQALAGIVIFHWNRVGYSLNQQGLLALALTRYQRQRVAPQDPV